MERDYGKELDELKEELRQLKEIITGAKRGTSDAEPAAPQMVGHVEKMGMMHPDPSFCDILDKLENSCGEEKDSGRVAYVGVFSSGGRQSTWIQNNISADRLLSLIENKTAEKVLACIGNNDRLNILLAILRKPMTVAQLVEEYGYNSTGQVYHHLKPLIAADLVAEDGKSKGYYVVVPHRVQGIIMLLAGISDIIDPEFTEGSWS